MNQAGMWLVVKPTVGLPLFISGVAITSLIVHYAVLSNTKWYPAYLEGGSKKLAAISAPASVASATAASVVASK